MSNAGDTRRESIAPALYAVGATGLLFTILSFAIFGARSGISTFAGATLATSNLWVLARIIRSILGGNAKSDAKDESETKDESSEKKSGDENAGGGGRAGAWGVFALVKMIVLFGGVYLMMTFGLVDPIPLVVGYGALPIGITLSTTFARMKP